MPLVSRTHIREQPVFLAEITTEYVNHFERAGMPLVNATHTREQPTFVVGVVMKKLVNSRG